MYNVCQIVYDIEAEAPVIYCGYSLEDDEEHGVYIYRKDTDKMEVIPSFDRLTHYTYPPGIGGIDIGEFVFFVGIPMQYFGRLEYKWTEITAYRDAANHALLKMEQSSSRPANI